MSEKNPFAQFDTPVADNPFAQFDKVEQKDESRTVGGTAKDTGIALTKGVLGLAQSGQGAINLATLGIAGKISDAVGVEYNNWSNGRD